jgi:hypothetical protein
LAFAADAGSFAALGCEDVGVAGVTPAQVVRNAVASTVWFSVARAAHREGPKWSELGFDGIGPGRGAQLRPSRLPPHAAHALANVVIFGLAERANQRITCWRFTEYGLVVTLVTVGLAMLYLWLRCFALA